MALESHAKDPLSEIVAALSAIAVQMLTTVVLVANQHSVAVPKSPSALSHWFLTPTLHLLHPVWQSVTTVTVVNPFRRLVRVALSVTAAPHGAFAVLMMPTVVRVVSQISELVLECLAGLVWLRYRNMVWRGQVFFDLFVFVTRI